MDPASMSYLLHFLLCFVGVVILTTCLGKKYLWIAILAMFLLGLQKEVRDYFVNPWHMSMLDLLKDCLWDIASNQIGIAAAGTCLQRLFVEKTNEDSQMDK